MISAKPFLAQFLLTMDRNIDKFKHALESAQTLPWDDGSRAAMAAMLADDNLSAAQARALWNQYNPEDPL